MSAGSLRDSCREVKGNMAKEVIAECGSSLDGRGFYQTCYVTVTVVV